MKQSRFLGIILAGFIFFGVGYSPLMVAAFEDDLAEDSFKSFKDADGVECAVDGEGNIIKDVTQDDVEAMNKALRSGEVKSLEDCAAKFGKSDNFLAAGSDDAKALIKSNAAAEKAISDLKNADAAKIDLGGQTKDLSDFTKFTKLQDLSGSCRDAIADTEKNAVAGLKKLQESLGKSDSTLEDLSSQYSEELHTIKPATLDKLATKLNDPSIANIEKDLATAVKANDKVAVEKLCVKVTKLKAMEEIVDQMEDLEKEGAGYAGEMKTTMDKALDDLNASFKEFEDTPALVRSEGSLGKFSDDVEKMGNATRKDLDYVDRRVNAELKAVGDRLGIAGRFAARPFGSIGERIEDFATSIKSITRDDVAEGFSSVGRTALKGIKEVGSLLAEGAKMLVSGVMFMIPNIFQAAFLAQKTRQVQLQTLAKPIKYGDWVFQIPDSCFNFDTPASTIPVYVRIPVAHVGDAVSPAMLTHYNNTVKGPSTDNKVSAAIHSVGATIFSFGGALSARPRRYNLHSEGQYLSYDPGIIMTYFPASSYQSWGSVPLTSSQFTTGQIIDVTTGMIIDGSGEQINATGIHGFDAYPLVALVDIHGLQSAPTPASVKDVLPAMDSKFELSNDVVRYTEYVSVASGSKAGVGSNSLKSKFDCACLDASATSTGTKSTGCGDACLINKALKQYELGISINFDGTVGLGTLVSAATSSPSGIATQAQIDQATQKNIIAAPTKAPAITPAPTEPVPTVSSMHAALLGRLSATPPLGSPAPAPAAPGAGAIPVSAVPATAGDSPNSYGLGTVIPLYGWGTNDRYPLLINPTTFPANSTPNLQGLGAVTKVGSLAHGISAASSNANPSNAMVQFADADTNYAAQGCWVYVSANTPFAQAVQAGSIETSVYGPYVDYIMFLDETGNQVPLTVAVQNTDAEKITTTTSGLNPAIKYWASLAAFDNTTSTSLPQFQDTALNCSVKYDLAGNEYADPALDGGKGYLATALMVDLQASFAALYYQIQAHQSVMVDKIKSGPFKYGNVVLILSQYSIQVPGSSASAPPQAEIVLYQGSKCYGSGVQDLFAVVDSVSGNTTTLPDATGTTFYSLITDITYTLTNGSLAPTDFSQAPLTQNGTTYVLNSTNLTTFNILDGTLNASLIAPAPNGYGAPAAGTSYVPQALSTYVTQQRQAWAQAFDPSAQKQGITVGALTCNLPAGFSTKAAIAAGCYIYEIVPMPSAVFCDHDLFVLVNGSAPSLDSLVPVNADIATATSIAVSLMTGFLFNVSDGSQVMHKSGAPMRLDVSGVASTTSTGAINKVQTVAGTIYNAICAKFDFETIAPTASASGVDFAAQYQQWVAAYEEQMHRPMGPYTFGTLNLGIFVGDNAIGNYVYFDAKGMYKADFQPGDIFVACSGSPSAGTFTPGAQLGTDTPYVLSLVSGSLYDPTGAICMNMKPEKVVSLSQSLTANWGVWLKQILAQRQAVLKSQVAAQEAEQTTLDALLTQIQQQHALHQDYLTASSVSGIIQGLQPSGLNGLQAPFGTLKKDDTREIYIHVSPASGTDSSNLLYLFFDIGVDKVTKKSIGGIYTAGGNVVHIVKDIELQNMRDQFGVVVDEQGAQKLGIPLTQPSFAMTDDDRALIIGQDSKDYDLVSNMSPYFPGGPVSMPKGFYLYYSTTMQSYYLYEVAQKRWIDASAQQIYNDTAGTWSTGLGGHVYEQDGSPVPLAQQVCVLKPSSKSKATAGAAGAGTVAAADEMLLLYENQNGDMQAYMSDGQNYVNIDSSSDTMTWNSLSSSVSYQVDTDKTGDVYTVTDVKGDSKTYAISDDVVWYSLYVVPIDAIDTGALLTKHVRSAYKNAELVMSGDMPTHMIFNSIMYKVSTPSSSPTTATMVPVDPSNKGSITVWFDVDPNTSAPYVKVTDGKVTYHYMYLMDSLDDAEQSLYQARMKGSPSVATIACAVGPQVQKTTTIGSQTITVSVPEVATHILFAKDIPSKGTGANKTLSLTQAAESSVVGVPTQGQAGYQDFADREQVFYNNVALVYQSSDGRFFVKIPPYSTTPALFMVSYVSNGAWVDLQNGLLYHPNLGTSLGSSLQMDDWLFMLDQLFLGVVTKDQFGATLNKGTTIPAAFNKAGLALIYRSPLATKIESEELQVDTSAVTRLKDYATTLAQTAKNIGKKIKAAVTT